MNITNRVTHDVQQGTEAWLRLREGFDTASEAPAALGVSKYTARAELLRRKHTGIAEEHDAATLGRFAAGHAAEALACPLAEKEVGDDLFPTTMTAEVDGLLLLASLDGQTLDGDVIWETKLWNEELAANVRAGTLTPHYTVQMDQELLVSGASRCLFTCTDGTPERYVSCWYEASEAKFAALIAGRKQFAADLAAYVPPATAEPARAEAMESLPAVSVRLDGALSVAGNLPTFAEALKAFIARMPTKPATDTDFATCEAACKSLKKAEEALDSAEAGALASITDVEAMRRAVADCRKLARDTRLAAEKLVERRKVEIKEQAVAAARAALDKHIADLNGELAPMRLQPVAADFAGSIKGLRSIASMQDALDTTLANGKITADAQARGIRANLADFKAAAAGFEFLFHDLGQLVHKPADDFATLVQARVDTHRAAEARREQERQAAEAARIAAAEQRAREEEAARITDEQRRQEHERQQAESKRIQAEADHEAALRTSLVPSSTMPPSMTTADKIERARVIVDDIIAAEILQASARHPLTVAPPTNAAEPATLNLGAIGARLGFALKADFIADTLHIEAAAMERGLPRFRESDFSRICAALIEHVENVQMLQAA